MLLGFSLLPFLFLYLIYVIISFCRGDTVQGWVSVIGVSLVVGSTQLIILGIMGEYIGKLLDESRKRPRYVRYASGPAREAKDDASAP